MKKLSFVFLLLISFSCQDDKANEELKTSKDDSKNIFVFEKIRKTDEDTIVVSVDTIREYASINKIVMLYSDYDSIFFSQITEEDLNYSNFLNNQIDIYYFSVVSEIFYVFSLEKIGFISLVYNTDFFREGIYLKETDLFNNDELLELNMEIDLYFDSLNEEYKKLIESTLLPK